MLQLSSTTTILYLTLSLYYTTLHYISNVLLHNYYNVCTTPYHYFMVLMLPLSYTLTVQYLPCYIITTLHSRLLCIHINYTLHYIYYNMILLYIAPLFITVYTILQHILPQLLTMCYATFSIPYFYYI